MFTHAIAVWPDGTPSPGTLCGRAHSQPLYGSAAKYLDYFEGSKGCQVCRAAAGGRRLRHFPGTVRAVIL